MPWRSPILSSLLFTVTLCGILCFLSIVPAFSLQPQTIPSELRGVWITNVDSAVMFSRANVDEAVQQLAQLNFNTIYPAVWNWGYTQYPSPVAKQAIGQTVDPRVRGLQGRDALAELVDEGHSQGLDVIPWFEFGFMTTAESELAERHPDWITTRLDGSQIWQDGIYQRRWLNPFHPEVQEFIQGLILELVTQYNIDGIQFDDHFGLPSEFGYDDFTVQLYRREHRGHYPPANPQDREWVQWRADKITAFMTQVFHAIKAHKQDVLVSVSPNRYDFSLNHYLQDWQRWERQGLIEELVIQIYTDSVASFLAELNQPEVQAARRHIPTGVGILTGLKDKPVPMRQVQERVRLARSQGFAGLSFFFYETLWNLTAENGGDRQASLRQLFATPMARPNLIEGWSPPR